MLRALWTGPNPHNVEQNDTILYEILRGSRIFPFWRSKTIRGPHNPAEHGEILRKIPKNVTFESWSLPRG